MPTVQKGHEKAKYVAVNFFVHNLPVYHCKTLQFYVLSNSLTNSHKFLLHSKNQMTPESSLRGFIVSNRIRQNQTEKEIYGEISDHRLHLISRWEHNIPQTHELNSFFYPVKHFVIHLLSEWRSLNDEKYTVSAVFEQKMMRLEYIFTNRNSRAYLHLFSVLVFFMVFWVWD